MSSEVETSRENTLEAVQRGSSTSLGMTKIALFQMRRGAESCYRQNCTARSAIDPHYRPDHGRRGDPPSVKDKTRTAPEAKTLSNS
jgi:hypothetical protein